MRFEDALWIGAGLLKLCSAQIRKIAYIAPQNSDVGFGTEFADDCWLIADSIRAVVCGEE